MHNRAFQGGRAQAAMGRALVAALVAAGASLVGLGAAGAAQGGSSPAVVGRTAPHAAHPTPAADRHLRSDTRPAELPRADHAAPAPAIEKTPEIAPLSAASVTLSVDTAIDGTPVATACAVGNADTCSLRAAVGTANLATGSVDVIEVPGGTYELTPGLGTLDVTNSVRIVGTGASQTAVVVEGDGEFQLLDVLSTGSTSARVLPEVLVDNMTWSDGGSELGGDIGDEAVLTLQDTTVTKGTALAGGDIYSATTAQLWMDAGTVVSHGTAEYGGGLYSYGSTVISGSTLSDDTATAEGGAIWNGGAVTATGATYSSDSAGTSGAVYFNTLVLTDTDGTYTDNTGTATTIYGTVMFNEGEASVTGATITGTASNAYDVTGGVFFNSAGLTLTDDHVADTTNTCPAVTAATCSIYGGVIENTYEGTTGPGPRPDLTVDGLTVTGTTNHPARIYGGVVANFASATLTDLTVGTTTNTFSIDYVDGGVLYNAAYTFDTGFAADLAATSVQITATTDTGTSGTTWGGVAFLAGPQATVSLTGVRITGTDVTITPVTGVGGTVNGGAIYHPTNGSLNDVSIADTHVVGAGDTVDGGALYTTGQSSYQNLSITTTTVTDVDGGRGYVVGGAWFDTTVAAISDSEILGTTVTAGAVVQGGALYTNDGSTITDSTIGDTDVSLPDTGSSLGGVADFATRQVVLTNVTVTGSTTTVGQGGVAEALLFQTSAQLTNDTIANLNVATATGSPLAGGSGALVASGETGTLNVGLLNTIVETTPESLNCVGLGASRFASAGGNLFGGAACGQVQPSDQVTTDALTAALADNGGPVETAALLPGSPAKGHGVATGAPAADARGIIRPAGDIDVGAFQTSGEGYVEVGADGAVYAFGTAPNVGTTRGLALTAPVTGIAVNGTVGYRLAATDGGVFAFDAQYAGSMASQKLNAPIVGIAADSAGGYWLAAADGGVFAFNGAGYYGSMGGQPLNEPIVGMAATPSGDGYWLVASDGGVFAFGDAGYHGSMGGQHLNQPVVGMASTPTGNGYWLVASDGGIFSFGTAAFQGSMGGTPLNQPVVGLAPAPTGAGYWEFAADGGVFSFGTADYLGAATGKTSAPIVGGGAQQQR